MWKTSGDSPVLLPHYLFCLYFCLYEGPTKLMLLFIGAVWDLAWNGKGTTLEVLFFVATAFDVAMQLEELHFFFYFLYT